MGLNTKLQAENKLILESGYKAPAEPPTLWLQHKTANGTGGGAYTASPPAWLTRPLTHTISNTISGATVNLTQNTFTLPVGSYYLDCTASVYSLVSGKLRLYNRTDAVDVFHGINWFATDIKPENKEAVLTGKFIVSTTPKEFEIQMLAYGTNANGLGYPVNLNTVHANWGSATAENIHLNLWVFKV